MVYPRYSDAQRALVSMFEIASKNIQVPFAPRDSDDVEHVRLHLNDVSK